MNSLASKSKNQGAEMPNKQAFEFHCPKCGKRATTAEPIFRNHAHRLQLRIFHCHECRLIYIDKITIRRLISEWRKSSGYTKQIPFEQLYREYLENLEKSVRTCWIRQLGYKQTRFPKRPIKQSP